MVDNSSLVALEGLLSEFFEAQTNNERKRQIEEVLGNFSQQRDAWKHCLLFCEATSNIYVHMYCLNTLENVITKQWVGLLGETKAEIRGSLNSLLLKLHHKHPLFIRNKLVKLIVDVARIDWPHFFPDFFPNMLHLCQDADTVCLGLVFIQTTSEELACPREDLSMSRKQEVKKLLLDQVPTLLSTLQGILEGILDKQKHSVTATPPPSPDGNHVADDSSYSWSSVSEGLLINSMMKNKASPLSSDNEMVAGLALSCLNHLFSWIPLSNNITPGIITVVFQFAGMGIHTEDTRDVDLGQSAMSAVNELMSKNCVPPDFQGFLLQLFQNTFTLLQQITTDHQPLLNDGYVSKFTEFVRLLVSVHLRRFEGSPQFPVLEFLSLLYNYTFQQRNMDGFYSCLDIWVVFLDYLNTRAGSRNWDSYKETLINRYGEALMTLTMEIVKKIQFRHNQNQLEELDNENVDDNDETEWQHFLHRCFEVVTRVADLLPQQTFQLLYASWEEGAQTYRSLDQTLCSWEEGRPQLNVTSESEWRKLHCLLRDLSTLLQSLGCLANDFIGDTFKDRMHVAFPFVKGLSELGAWSTRVNIYKTTTSVPTLQEDLIEVHSRILSTLKAWCCWLKCLQSLCAETNTYVHDYNDIIGNVVHSIVPIIVAQDNEKVLSSSVHLLCSLTATVRPPTLMHDPQIQQLFLKANSLRSMRFQCRVVLYRGLSNMLLLPWPNTDNQNWPSRQQSLTCLIQDLTRDFTLLVESPGFFNESHMQERGSDVIIECLGILSEIIKPLLQEKGKTKQLCFSCVQSVIHTALNLIPVYIQHSKAVEAVVGFFHVLLDVLRIQMGVPLAEQTIQTFMEAFSKMNLRQKLWSEKNSSSNVVYKFLQILELIVEEPGSAFKRFIPSTISLCLDIYPVLVEVDSVDAQMALFSLFHKLLSSNWKYWFPGGDTVERRESLILIMRAFAASFTYPHPQLFRLNLQVLESLNSRWKLYSRPVFRSEMLGEFASLLLTALVSRSHDLLGEEMGIALYNMAAVDFGSFFSSFLPLFLRQAQGLDDGQRTTLLHNFKCETDLPSFTENVYRFVNDLRYYRLCNSSLPPGSVML